MTSYLKQAREWAYPRLKESAFLERGVLTPEEFVIAGDELVYKCPTWSWEGGDPSRAKNYLPIDKQFLVTRGVPCQVRVSVLENSMSLEMDSEGDEEGDDWLVSHVKKEDPHLSNNDDEFDILDQDGEVVVPVTKEQPQQEQQEEEEYADMADFEDDNVVADEYATASATQSQSIENQDNIVKVRTYDLSITYDKYYQTPRLWMMGYTAAGSQPLTGKEMMEDVISDYANRTVTIETHPHVKGPHASIHPCQHGKVMKTIVHNLSKASAEPTVEMYMFIFLKFVSSIIPTINYDFTMDVTADTSKS